MRSLLLSNSGYLFTLMQPLRPNCDRVLGALGPSRVFVLCNSCQCSHSHSELRHTFLDFTVIEAVIHPLFGAVGPSPSFLSCTGQASMYPASLSYSHSTLCRSHSEAERGRAAVLLLSLLARECRHWLAHHLGVSAVTHLLTVPWTNTKCPARNGKTAALHTSQSWRLCCIAGLELGIVSTSNSAFHVLWFSSSSVSLVSLLFSAYSSCPCSGTMYSCGVAHVMLCFETKKVVDAERHSIGLAFRSFIFLHIPTNLCATFVQVPTHCATASSTCVRGSDRRFFKFCTTGPLLSVGHMAAPREVARKVHFITCKILWFVLLSRSSCDHGIMCASGVSVEFLVRESFVSASCLGLRGSGCIVFES